MHNCAPLIQLIKAKVNSWSARSLSYAGRLLLLNTVINGITNFWTSTFILPKACISKINSLCSAFLWHGTTEGSHSAKVAWESVILSKAEGGLGCRDLRAWNKACTVKLIWLLFKKSGSIWVAWFIKEILKGELSNFWTIKPKQQHPWLVKKLLQLRSVTFQWIRTRVGSGTSVRFWSDHWSPLGAIKDFLAPVTSNTMGIVSTATLSSIFTGGTWRIRAARSDKQVSVQALLTSITLTTEPDEHYWFFDDREWQKYDTSAIYNFFKVHSLQVPWRDVIWAKGGIPKHNFHSWLVTLNRLPTRYRLLSWGLNTDARCLLCSAPAESRDHLFFDCNFSSILWNQVASRLDIAPLRSWSDSLIFMQTLAGPAWYKRLCYLAWKLVIYALWMERNSRLHRQQYRSCDSLYSAIDRTVRNKIHSYRDVNPAISSNMMQYWLR